MTNKKFHLDEIATFSNDSVSQSTREEFMSILGSLFHEQVIVNLEKVCQKATNSSSRTEFIEIRITPFRS